MARRQPPTVTVTFEMTPVAAGYLKTYLENIIPHRATPEHVRHTLFALHSKVVRAIEQESGE